MTTQTAPAPQASTPRPGWPALGALLAFQLLLVGVAVAPQLSARFLGDEITVRVEPLDPIDPFRGAYVTLGYPDLRHDDSESADGGLGDMEDDEKGRVFVSLVERDGLWVADEFTRERPDGGTYLACDDRHWQIRCGIESFFVPQDEARELEDALSDGDMVARIKVDWRGNASVVAVEPR